MKHIEIYALLFFLIFTRMPLIVDSQNVSALSDPQYLDAFRDLQPEWTSETLYQTNPLGPASICETAANEVLILDVSLHEILELNLDGSVSIYLQTGNISLSAIAFQPIANRIIGIGGGGFYVSNETSFEVLKEHPPNVSFSTLVVDPTDDSIYTGSWENDSSIYHFNADGEYLDTLRSGILGCAQVAFDASSNLLYYSEPFLGRITRLNITTNISTVLTSGIAIPGTGEGISIALSPLGDLFYLVAEGIKRGFYKYNGTAFNEIMMAKLGIGAIIWSEKFNSILCTPGYGACVIQYDPEGTKPVRLTPTVNTRSLIETSDGLLLLGLEDTIYQIETDSMLEFVSDLPYDCGNLVLDGDENIYVRLVNDSVSILKIDRDGTNTSWFTRDMKGFPTTLAYDSKNDVMILMTYLLGNKTFDIWRLPVGNPDDYSKITSIENVTGGDLTVDRSGNIYVLERSKNVLYVIPDESDQVQVLITNVVEHAYLVHPHIAYSTKADAIILCRNDDLQAWPVNGQSSYILGISATGIDHEGLFENGNEDLVGTHSGQIFRLSYDDSTDSTSYPETTTKTVTSTEPTTPSVESTPLTLELISIVTSIFIIAVIMVRTRR